MSTNYLSADGSLEGERYIDGNDDNGGLYAMTVTSQDGSPRCTLIADHCQRTREQAAAECLNRVDEIDEKIAAAETQASPAIMRGLEEKFAGIISHV